MFNSTLHRSPVSGRLKHDAGSLDAVVIPVVVLPILEPLHARKGRGASKGRGAFALLLASCSPSLLLAFALLDFLLSGHQAVGPCKDQHSVRTDGVSKLRNSKGDCKQL